MGSRVRTYYVLLAHDKWEGAKKAVTCPKFKASGGPSLGILKNSHLPRHGISEDCVIMCYYCWEQGNWRIGQAVSAWLDDPIPFKAAKRLVRWSSQCVFGCLKIAISRISAPFPLHKYVWYTFSSRLHISSLFSRRFSNPNWIINDTSP